MLGSEKGKADLTYAGNADHVAEPHLDQQPMKGLAVSSLELG